VTIEQNIKTQEHSESESSGLLADIEKYKQELTVALETQVRANQGSDKSWRRECREDVERLRNNIRIKLNALKNSS
jgi:hypothetical protein